MMFTDERELERHVFTAAMSQIAGRRLTYSDLTGKSDSPHHAETGTGTEVPF